MSTKIDCREALTTFMEKEGLSPDTITPELVKKFITEYEHSVFEFNQKAFEDDPVKYCLKNKAKILEMELSEENKKKLSDSIICNMFVSKTFDLRFIDLLNSELVNKDYENKYG